MLKRIKEIFGLSKKQQTDERNILIIGPTSCGKTTIIYFLYHFAMLHFLKNEKENSSTDSPVPFYEMEDEITNGRDGKGSRIIKEKLSEFIQSILKATLTSKNIDSTQTSDIKLLYCNTGKLKLKIYNISGEIFSKPDVHGDILSELCDHLETLDVEKTYTLLCDECDPSGDLNYNITFFELKALFNEKGHKAQKIIANIANNINTLRVVTKFDAYLPTERPVSHGAPQDDNFEIIHSRLSKLNQEGNKFMENHIKKFDLANNPPFTGSNNEQYYRQFICTGLYDKHDFTPEIYETDTETNTKVFKEQFRGHGFTKLNMYGINEIFTYMLLDSPAFKDEKILMFPNKGTGDHAISHADYRKILSTQSK